MNERRQHSRIAVNCWASLRHPLLGVYTAAVEEMSSGGMSLRLDEKSYFFVMMEVDVRFHGENWDDSMPPVTAQVVRIDDLHVALRFPESCGESWVCPLEEEFDMLWGDTEELTSPALLNQAGAETATPSRWFRSSENNRATETAPQRSAPYIGRIESGLP